MKRQIRWIQQKLFYLKQRTLIRKIVIGYIFLVFLPVILFGSIFLYLLNKNILDNFLIGKQGLVNQAAESLEVSLTQVASTYPLFQNNSPVLDYLNGQYQYEGDQVYHFLKEVRPVFTFAYSSNTSINSVRLYKEKKSVMSVPGELDSLHLLGPSNLRNEISHLKIDKGKWIPIDLGNTKIPNLTFYHKIYNEQYTDELAILEVKVSEKILSDFIDTINLKNKSDVVIAKGNHILYESPELKSKISNVRNIINVLNQNHSKPYLYWKDEKMLVNSVKQDDLQLSFYFFGPTDKVFANINNQSLLLGISMLFLLIVLSVIYYLTASNLTSRVLNLARHMRKVDQYNLTKLDAKQQDDELGYLTASYNSMIQRIDELVNKVHVTELMKKEADYLVMQAQIKPHFLYNTLESIRMMAEMNDDQDVVDATYTFGKLLRYSLSPKGNETSLRDEVENIMYFLKIHKVRMMDRLQFNIQVDANIDNIRCPRFILQPLVENCINHGLSKIRKKGNIQIHIHEKGSFLQITIADNGAGIPQDRMEIIREVLSNQVDRGILQTNDSGLGLFNVSERIKVFFGSESTFEIDSKIGEGTVYTLNLKI